MNFDLSLGIDCLATIFGLNYDGSRDKGDNGIGAFEDPKTGRFYRTANQDIVGVSIPIPFYEETPDMSRSDIEHGLVTAIIQDSTGKVWTGLKIVDLGPGKHGDLIKDRHGIPHLLDRTYALCKMMGRMDDERITYWLVKDGQAYNIQGQNMPYVVIG